MTGITEEALDVHITSLVAVIPNAPNWDPESSLVLAGVGGNLEVYLYDTYNHKTHKICSRRLLKGANIHGLVRYMNNDRQSSRATFVAFGSKQWIRFEISTTAKISISNLSELRICKDWIFGGIWISDRKIAFITGHNRVEFVNVDLIEASTEISTCEEKCILYSGTLVQRFSCVFAICGTVFQEIIIWKASSGSHENKVIRRLTGHEGVIFSVNYNEELSCICSTSDDRTARVWKMSKGDFSQAEIHQILTLRNNGSRIYRSLLLPSHIITASEDSKISVWNYNDGQLQNEWNAHNGSSIWALASSPSQNIFFSGGGDCAIRAWSHDSFEVPKPSPVGNLWENSPKVVTYFHKFILVLDRKGQCFSWNPENCEMKLLFHNECLSNYALMEVHNDMIICASQSGKGFVYTLTYELNIVQDVSYEFFNGKIFSLVILQRYLSLWCGPSGRLKVVNLKSGKISNEFNLPRTGDQHFVSCGTLSLNNNYIFVGDRNGFVHVYEFSYDQVHVVEDPITTSQKLHVRYGVSDMTPVSGSLLTVGGDGILKTLLQIEPDGWFQDLSQSQFIVQSFRTPLSCLASIWEYNYEQVLLLGFRSTSFSVFSVNENRSLVEVDCGGSHRSWAFRYWLPHELVYIKDGQVFRVVFPDTSFSMTPLRSSFHSKTVNVVQHFSFGKRNYVVTAGEDVDVKVHQILELKEDLYKTSILNLSGHISSVRCAKIFQLKNDDRVLLVTGGGRAQIRAWIIQRFIFPEFYRIIFHGTECGNFLVRGNDKRRKKVWRDSDIIHDTEMRIMDLEVKMKDDQEENCLIYAGCSDGVLRVLELSLRRQQISLHSESRPLRKCILKLTLLEEFIVTATTDGFLTFWQQSEDDIVLVRQIQAQESGINSIVGTPDRKLITGSDGGDICLYDTATSALTSNKRCHAAQITCLLVHNDLVISASVDQRITVWRRDKEDKLTLLNQRYIDVADVQNMTGYLSKNGTVITLAIVGKGIGYYSVNV